MASSDRSAEISRTYFVPMRLNTSCGPAQVFWQGDMAKNQPRETNNHSKPAMLTYGVESRIETCEERAMIMRRTQLIPRKPQRREQGRSEHDPAKLSNKLRELASRAHALVRTTGGSGSEIGPLANEAVQELTDVHIQIVQLQQNLGAARQDNLSAYVAALRQRVEDYLA